MAEDILIENPSKSVDDNDDINKQEIPEDGKDYAGRSYLCIAHGSIDMISLIPVSDELGSVGTSVILRQVIRVIWGSTTSENMKVLCISVNIVCIR